MEKRPESLCGQQTTQRQIVALGFNANGAISTTDATRDAFYVNAAPAGASPAGAGNILGLNRQTASREALRHCE
jgi:hypothetical protein